MISKIEEEISFEEKMIKTLELKCGNGYMDMKISSQCAFSTDMNEVALFLTSKFTY